MTAEQLSPAGPGRVGSYRWVVCALLFFATTINYIDRQILGILKPMLETEFGWSESDYGDIVFWFQTAYALGLLGVGRLIDRLGTRRGFAFAISLWSVAAMAHALARSVAGFAVARFALGLGEAGNFPGAIKTVAEWFPKRERALATGLFNAGSNVGAIITPLLVPVIALSLGWEAAFIITGALGFIWLVAWLLLYGPPQTHPRVSAAELAHIQSDPEEPATAPVPWSRLLTYRQTWAFAAAKFLTDPVWWFFLFWLPDFLGKTYGLGLAQFGPPLVVIYLAADVGSVGGGWVSSRLMRKGWSLNAARKVTMLLCALCVVPVAFAMQADSLWAAVAIIGLAAAAHQGWSANLFTLVSDTFPSRAVGSVVGIGGMAGAVGGMLMAKYVGWVLEEIGSYVPLFATAATAYLLALLVIHLLLPRLDPAPLGELQRDR